MVALTLKSTGNITGNSYAVGTSALCNAKPQLFAGYLVSAGISAQFRDGANGPIVYWSNAVGVSADTETFTYPIFCANGVYVNVSAAAANTIMLLG